MNRPRVGVVAESVRIFSPSRCLLGWLMRRGANQHCFLSESGGGQHVANWTSHAPLSFTAPPTPPPVSLDRWSSHLQIWDLQPR